MVVLAAILAILALEGALRLCGAAYARIRLRANTVAVSPGQRVVLCIGDSFTFGHGVSSYLSYPAQLQIFLDRRLPNAYRVYNEGESGLNSSQLLERLPFLLRKYRPEILVTMIGNNESSQLVGSDYFLFAPASGARAAGASFLRNIRTWRLYKIVRTAWPVLRYGRRSRRVSYPPDAGDPVGRYKALAEAGRLREAERMLHQVVKTYPGVPDGFYYLAEVQERLGLRLKSRAKLEQARASVEAFLRVSRSDPRQPWIKHGLQLRSNILVELGETLPPEQAAIERLFQSNVVKAVRLASKSGVRVYMANYPRIEQASLSAICAMEGCGFIDTHAAFEPLLRGGAPYRWFIGDRDPPEEGHPNEAGYGVIAAAVGRALLEERP